MLGRRNGKLSMTAIGGTSAGRLGGRLYVRDLFEKQLPVRDAPGGNLPG